MLTIRILRAVDIRHRFKPSPFFTKLAMHSGISEERGKVQHQKEKVRDAE